MTAEQPAKRRSPKRFALPLLVLGGVLLAISAWMWISTYQFRSAAVTQPTTTPSKVMVTTVISSVMPSPGSSGTLGPTVTSVPSVVPIQTVTVISAPPSDGMLGDVTAIVTAISGLLASAAGLITAMVSARATKQ